MSNANAAAARRHLFLDLTVVEAPEYSEVLQHAKNGATFLDLGCCLGQVTRKLVCDGAPGENLPGSELGPAFVELGHELFRDKHKLSATFKTGDFFGVDLGGLESQSFDYIYGGAFFHLFTWEEQVEAMSRAIGLLKQKSGSTIFGWQTGAEKPGSRAHYSARSGELYSHNEQSFEKLVSEVTDKTGVGLSTDVSVDGDNKATGANSRDGGDWQYLRFSITWG